MANEYPSKVDTSRIKLGHIDVDLYSTVAEQIANAIHLPKQEKNKSAQIRRFYDELVMWHDKVFTVVSEQRDAKFSECAPYIQMILAKVAYAKGRGHIDENFLNVMNTLIRQIENPATLKQAKLFFEAVLGFRKAFEKN